MSNFWKWIVGIVILLFVITGLMVGSHLLLAGLNPADAGERVIGFRAPGMMGDYGFSGTGMMDTYGLSNCGYGGRMHGGGTMLFGWLGPLLVVGLIIYGAYWLGSRRSTKGVSPATIIEPVVLRTCPRCGNQVQVGWNNCAHCGKKLD